MGGKLYLTFIQLVSQVLQEYASHCLSNSVVGFGILCLKKIIPITGLPVQNKYTFAESGFQ